MTETAIAPPNAAAPVPTGAGLIMVKNNDQIEAEKQQKMDMLDGLNENSPQVTELAAFIRKCWESAKSAKDEEVSNALLMDQRQRKGVYESDKQTQIAQTGGTDIFMRITAIKCVHAEAWIRDVLAPTDEKPWGLEPTPEPDVNPEIKEAIVGNAMAFYEQESARMGGPIPPAMVFDYAVELRGLIERLQAETAKQSSEAMEKKIEDQLVEGNFYEEFLKFISDLCTFKSAIFKGPVMERRRKLVWGDIIGDTGYEPIVEDVIEMRFYRVSPYDFYPSPSSGNVNEGYMMEKRRFQRKELLRLRGIDGYDEDAIDAALNEYGQKGLREYVEYSDSERASLEEKEAFDLGGNANDDMIDGLEFHGSVQGKMLREWGIKDIKQSEELNEFDMWGILIGTHVIKAELNPHPLGRGIYYCTSFEKEPGSIWGHGIPEKMRPEQDAYNATWRSLINNLAVASGPQVTINTEALSPDEVLTTIQPFKIWQYEDSTGQLGKPVDFFQPSVNANQLMPILQELATRADEDTGIPRYIYGDENVGGAGSTARGLSMLMNAASKGIKQVISNVDEDVIKPLIRNLYEYNMLYDEDDSIKGDLQVRPRGALGLLIKEQQEVARNQFMVETNNPTDMAIIGQEGRAELLRSRANDLALPKDLIVPSRAELVRRKMEAAETREAQLEQEMANANAEAVAEEAGAESGLSPTGLPALPPKPQ